MSNHNTSAYSNNGSFLSQNSHTTQSSTNSEKEKYLLQPRAKSTQEAKHWPSHSAVDINNRVKEGGEKYEKKQMDYNTHESNGKYDRKRSLPTFLSDNSTSALKHLGTESNGVETHNQMTGFNGTQASQTTRYLSQTSAQSYSNESKTEGTGPHTKRRRLNGLPHDNSFSTSISSRSGNIASTDNTAMDYWQQMQVKRQNDANDNEHNSTQRYDGNAVKTKKHGANERSTLLHANSDQSLRGNETTGNVELASNSNLNTIMPNGTYKRINVTHESSENKSVVDSDLKTKGSTSTHSTFGNAYSQQQTIITKNENIYDRYDKNISKQDRYFV
ncbi:Rab GTPase domain-containing protein [Reticulomyxa filosa]|uniref:Rab GTPase domain-containing protein n=1 Tax=Reticulomyxa filosa TaxID=46433 RepID=X6MJB6_RETFI|nr:Rab GTPase domain-containing protein [Reticulomyxa filosa]|eukprot:ETO14108.1 Rab GTPase domain-containing protein [Reticulomyxa filosa]